MPIESYRSDAILLEKHRLHQQDRLNYPHEWSLQDRLTKDALRAYNAHTFTERSTSMVDTVAHTVTDMMTASLYGKKNLLKRVVGGRKIEKIVRQAVTQASEAYRPYFTVQGEFSPSDTCTTEMFDTKQIPMKAAGKAALSFLPELVAAAGIKGYSREKVYALLERVTFKDTLAFTAKEVGGSQTDLDTLQALPMSDMKHRLLSLIPEEKSYTRKLAENLASTEAQHSLTAKELQVLDLALRLANATWQVGQVHRAKRNEKTERISPDYLSDSLEVSPDRGVFRVYDMLLRVNYSQWKGRVGTQNALLGTTLVETWKDAYQYITALQEPGLRRTGPVENEKKDKTSLEMIHPEERLVAPDFQINIPGEIAKGSRTPYPGYPSPKDRLKMDTFDLVQWQKNGSKTKDLPGYQEGNYVITDHPNYLQGVEKKRAIVDNGQDFHSAEFAETFYEGGYNRDERGLPVRPFDNIFLQSGAVDGIGFYYQYGPNRAADPVVFRQRDGKLQLLVIARRDMSEEAERLGKKGEITFMALPGGMQDPHEPGVSTAVRELFEEAGVDLQGVRHEVVYEGIVWADPRATRHAWPESTVALLLPDSDKVAKIKLKNQEEETKAALWADVNQETVEQLFASHPSFVKLALLKYEQITGMTVDKQGRLKKSNLI